MKFLKVMLAVLTCLAVTLTGVLLFVDKHGPAISRSTTAKTEPRIFETQSSPSLNGVPPGLGDVWLLRLVPPAENAPGYRASGGILFF